MRILKCSLEKYFLRWINIDRYLPLQLDITNTCNLKCIHCYHSHHNNVGSIKLGDWKKILFQYKELINELSYRPSFVFCGGEPFASPELIPLLEFVTAEFEEPKISVLTNGTLVTAENTSLLRKFRNLKFQVSIDGPDKERHDLIRGSGNFEKAILGIKTLQNMNFKVNVLSVLSRGTEPWMEDFFILAKTQKFNSMNFTRFIPEGQGRFLVTSTSDRPLVGLELKSAYQHLIKMMLKYQVKSKIQSPLFDLILPSLGRSGRFWESIVVDYQGYIIASSRSKLRLGHAISDGLKNIFLNHPIYDSLRKGKISICGGCEHLSVCGGDRNAAYADSGDFLGKDPGCWKDIETPNQNRRAQ